MFWKRRKADEEVQQEIQAHLELEAREQKAGGMTEAEAQDAARRAFGNVALTMEDTRAAHGGAWWEARWADLRFGARLLGRQPGFTLVAMATLALAIGANTVIFSVIDAAMLRPLPFENAGELVTMRSNQSWPDAADILAQSRTFSGGGGLTMMPMDLVGSGEPQQVEAGFVTPGLLGTLGVAARRGRVFTEEEENQGPPSVILLHGFWQRHFGGDEGIVGRAVRLGGAVYRVSGVMPAEFQIPPFRLDLLVPLKVGYLEGANARGAHFLRTYWRLKEGTSLEQARAEMAAIDQRLAREYPIENKGRRTVLLPMQEWLSGRVRDGLLALLAAVGVVLLIACVNLANMLLARAVTRQGEMGIRSALGASRGRMVGQLMVESLLLGLGGGAAGLALSRLMMAAVEAVQPVSLKQLPPVTLDYRVMVFTLGLTLLTTVVFGLLPAWRTVSLGAGTRGATAGPGVQRWRSALVMSEVAMALMLVVSAALLVRTFQKLSSVDPGFRPEQVMTLRMQLPQSRYGATERQTQFRRTVLERLAAIPGVEASMVSELPLSGSWLYHNMIVEGRPPVAAGDEPEVQSRSVMGGYWTQMGIPLRQGRLLTDADREGTPLAGVVNDSFVRTYLSGREPIGARVRWARAEGDPQWITIVGVCGDVRHFSLMQGDDPAVYTPYAQTPHVWKRWMALVIHTGDTSAAQLERVKQEIWRVDPEVPVTHVQRLGEVVSESLDSHRFYMLLFGVFAGIALLMAAAGVFAVISFLVVQRQKEIGIRIALGARPGDVLGLVMRQTAWLAGVGLAVGLAGTAAAAKWLKSMLYGVDWLDPVSMAAAVLLLVLTALAAAAVPSRRAARTDAAEVLRA